MHVARFWLGVLVRNMRSECPYATSIVAEILTWYLFHNTLSGLPRYLHEPLIDALDLIQMRLMDSEYKFKQGASTALPTTLRLKTVLAGLRWLLASDDATKALMPHDAPPKGKELYQVQTPVLDTVRLARNPAADLNAAAHARKRIAVRDDALAGLLKCQENRMD